MRRICRILAEQYGTPRLGNPPDPVDDLVFITLSNKTTPATASRLFALLKKSFPNWEMAVEEGPEAIATLIKPGGFAQIKANYLHSALSQILRDFGACRLDELALCSEEETFAYLISLPGVSNKVARCVMLYTLGFDVLPVDNHVFRVAKRLGLTTKNRADLAHEQLEELVPRKDRLGFHVNGLMHGREVCRPKKPDCSRCVISAYCAFYKHHASSDVARSL